MSDSPKVALCLGSVLCGTVCCCLSIAAGPDHAPHFDCMVKIRGWEFSGTGSTKKQAKTAAAEAALKYLHDVHSIDALTGKDPAAFAEGNALKMGQFMQLCLNNPFSVSGSLWFVRAIEVH